MSINVCTTFNKEGLDLYGQTFLNTYAKNVDKKIKLTVYAENCVPENPDPTQIWIVNQIELKDLLIFKSTWRDVPMANGTCPFPQKRPHDYHKEFKWDAVRFANKVYAVFDACDRYADDVLLPDDAIFDKYDSGKGNWIVWMDADTVVHSPWSYDDFKAFLKDDRWLTYVGRGKGSQTWPECGFYGIDISSTKAQQFIKYFKWMYDNANIGIFKLDEWHDSYVFGHCIEKFKVMYTDMYDVTSDMYLKEARTGGGDTLL